METMDMDHGGHGSHGDGGHGGGCSMKMLFNWDTERICIVFSWWSVNNIGFLILSCIIVTLLAASFEFLRYLSRKYDSKIYVSSHSQLQEERDANSEEVSATSTTKNNDVIRITHAQRLIRTLIHTVQVFISFFLMLIFMTYNGFLMISVIVGAAIGYFVFAKHTLTNQESGGRPITCH